MHPTSLPGQFGIGTLDHEAEKFLRFLAAAGIKYWQLCPLGPTGFGDSPYQCFSSFAGNPYLIDLVPLVAAGLIGQEALGPLLFLNAQHVDYGGLYNVKRPILFQVHAGYRRDPKRKLPYGSFEAFRKEHAAWLPAFTAFSAIKDHLGGAPWWLWPAEIRHYDVAARSPLLKQLEERIEAYAFIQYLFFGQWNQLRAKARELGVSIIGDAPIFTALDSADVWASPELFQLDRDTGRPTAVAGVPPDYFSADGQLWGNPLYDWPAHAASNYAWWVARLKANFTLCDIVRIDHFRGFESYWAVPADAKNARNGRWVPGPGLEFFKAINKALPEAHLIAEDLGVLTPEVIALRDATGLPGMAVLQFAFGDDADNLYLPHNQRANSVVYSGTHDNDTTLGWYAATDEKARDHVRRYFRVSGQEVAWDFIRASYASVANLAIMPLQDLMKLGGEARFNTPGKAEGNWQWRYQSWQLEQLERESSAYLRDLGVLYGRIPVPKK